MVSLLMSSSMMTEALNGIPARYGGVAFRFHYKTYMIIPTLEGLGVYVHL